MRDRNTGLLETCATATRGYLRRARLQHGAT